jgi:hypothetical protein
VGNDILRIATDNTASDRKRRIRIIEIEMAQGLMSLNDSENETRGCLKTRKGC